MRALDSLKLVGRSKVVRRLALMWASTFLLVFMPVAWASQVMGPVLVVGVSDGDTITVLDEQKKQHRIRLMGIDAPESRQAFGTKSKGVLSRWVYRQRVTIHFREFDRFGRIIGRVELAGRDVNLEMVLSGHAWHYEQFARGQFRGDADRYHKAQQEAKAQGLGLWSQPNPVAPWDFRRERRTTS